MDYKAKEVVPNLYWVGVFDRDLRVFDIVMETPYGTSYNAFLLQTSKGNVLFETCKAGFSEECISRIESVIGKEGTIEYIILNHTEPDHSGSLVDLLKRYPKASIIATVVALQNIQNICHFDDSVKVISSNKLKVLDMGNYSIKFLCQPFLHWPDTMMSVIPELKAIVTCDFFGEHLYDDRVFNDLMPDRKVCIDDSFRHYFNTVLLPFKSSVLKGVNLIETQMGFPADELKAICCSHGPVLRTNIREYMEKYKEWAQPTVLKNKVIIYYGSAYGYTKEMVDCITDELRNNNIEVIVHDCVTSSYNVVLKDFEDAKGLLLGSPTIIGDALPPLMMLLCNINPFIHGDRFLGCFGSFGWSGEGIKNIQTRIDQIRCKQPVKPISFKFKLTEENLLECKKWASDYATALKK
ncbi:A-type flavoprotein [Entamoeba marina]